MKKITLVFVLLSSFIFAWTQNKVVTGSVKDDKGEVVPFATITETGTTNTAQADANGNFSITVQNGAKITATSTGHQPQTLAADFNILNFVLARNEGQLTEVVVTALGQSQNKAKLGYSTATFNSATITRNGSTGILDNLQGKVAGVEISNTGGPGSSTKVILKRYRCYCRRK